MQGHTRRSAARRSGRAAKKHPAVQACADVLHTTLGMGRCPANTDQRPRECLSRVHTPLRSVPHDAAALARCPKLPYLWQLPAIIRAPKRRARRARLDILFPCGCPPLSEELAGERRQFTMKARKDRMSPSPHKRVVSSRAANWRCRQRGVKAVTGSRCACLDMHAGVGCNLPSVQW